MSSGGFLCKWNSNSVLKLILSADQGKHEDQPLKPHQTISKSPSSGDPDKLLGFQWIHDVNEFKFHLGELQVQARSLPSSKRSVLRITAGIFDPLGFLSLFLINLKIMYRKYMCG